ncbi:ComF family protein [Tianweitania sediminis]|uniref:ComF family protein n=1 Tax=Tianweitania sediminis TaxID=1502156 RepID=UPI0031583FB5
MKFGSGPAAVFQALGRVLFPPSCLGCQTELAQPGSLCGRCWPSLRRIERPFCPVLGTPFDADLGEGVVSLEAIADPPPFARARSVAVHTGLARRLAADLKYRDRTDLAPWMAQWMLRSGGELLADADLIVPVPLHRRRFFQRRYNQSAELARCLAGLADRPFAPHVILRRRATRQQVGLGAKQREDNVRGAFQVTEKGRILLKNKRVLVVDDVYTTGATVGAVSRALLRGGAAAVDVLTFSRVLPDSFSADDLEP